MNQPPNQPNNALRLTVTPVLLGVVALPGLPAAGSGLGVAVALVETAGLLAGGSETTGLAVLKTQVYQFPISCQFSPLGEIPPCAPACRSS